MKTIQPMSAQMVTSSWAQGRHLCHDGSRMSRRLGRTLVLATFDRDRWMGWSELTPGTWGHYLLATCPFSCLSVWATGHPLHISSQQRMWGRYHCGHKERQNSRLYDLIWNTDICHSIFNIHLPRLQQKIATTATSYIPTCKQNLEKNHPIQ